jgi:hypothetical protein
VHSGFDAEEAENRRWFAALVALPIGIASSRIRNSLLDCRVS